MAVLSEYGEVILGILTETGAVANGAITEVGELIINAEPIVEPITRLFLNLGALAIQLTGE